MSDKLYVAEPIRVRNDDDTVVFDSLDDAKAYVEECVDGHVSNVAGESEKLEEAEWNQRTFNDDWGYDVVEGPGKIAGYITVAERGDNV